MIAPPASPARRCRPRWAAACAPCLSAAIAACSAPADTRPSDLFYAWDDRTVLCSDPIDDLEGVTRDWDAEQARFAEAGSNAWVTMVHAHQPNVTVSRAALERVFGWADQYGLDYVRFDQLTPDDGPRPGLAFAFDDDDVAGWLSVRDILDAHHAKVTFFITRWFEMDAASKAGIAELAAEGHDIEPHRGDRPRASDLVPRPAGQEDPTSAVLADAGCPTPDACYSELTDGSVSENAGLPEGAVRLSV